MKNEKIIPKVKMISSTNHPYLVLYLAFSECYSAKSAVTRLEENNIPNTEDELVKKVSNLIEYGHESPLEHVSATFAVDNISRACSHQLVRHRLASYSQKSQRYVNTKEMNFFAIPESIENDKEVFESSKKIISDISKFTIDFENRIENEDLRALLPNATITSLIFTMNIRELFHFFSQRCCIRAQSEIRLVANQTLKICKEWMPEVFENAGPNCVRHGICFEVPKFSCKPEICIKNIRNLINSK